VSGFFCLNPFGFKRLGEGAPRPQVSSALYYVHSSTRHSEFGKSEKKNLVKVIWNDEKAFLPYLHSMNLNTIYNEDCLDTLARMPDDFIDLILTSPPYDDMRDYKGYSFDVERVVPELFRVAKPGAVVVWVVADRTVKGSETGTSFRQALAFMEAGFNLFDTMIYLKPPRGASGNNRGYWQCFEYMFVFSKGRPKTINLIKDRPNKESRKGDNGTKRLANGELQKVARGGYADFGRRTNVWEYAIGKGHSTKDEIAFNHPAIFPEKLAEDHILSWSIKGDLVFDPFIGSGTVAKLALLNQRKYLGSEISVEYCQIAEQRLKSASAKVSQCSTSVPYANNSKQATDN
jgi:site-specific DNA-methyltransferase (adenine-specific)